MNRSAWGYKILKFITMQSTLARCSLCPVRLGTCVEEVSLLQKRGFYSDSDVMGSPLLFPASACAGSRLMRFIVKVPEKFVLAIHFVPMAGVPTLQTSLMVCRQSLLAFFQRKEPVPFFDCHSTVAMVIWTRGGCLPDIYTNLPKHHMQLHLIYRQKLYGK
ncbi:hypothetical protein XENOCAPTIV_023447 [Xenoophorus captivus]|uniref:Secreted protein n=1 Tax=Xenoophorus captivus TaxID=1517983 RepID=A0ABV0S8N3_9TELE